MKTTDKDQEPLNHKRKHAEESEETPPVKKPLTEAEQIQVQIALLQAKLKSLPETELPASTILPIPQTAIQPESPKTELKETKIIKLPIAEALDRLHREYARDIGDQKNLTNQIMSYFSHKLLKEYRQGFPATYSEHFAQDETTKTELEKLFSIEIYQSLLALLFKLYSDAGIEEQLPEAMRKLESYRILKAAFAILRTTSVRYANNPKFSMKYTLLLIWKAAIDQKNLDVTQKEAGPLTKRLAAEFGEILLKNLSQDETLTAFLDLVLPHSKILQRPQAAVQPKPLSLGLLKDFYNSTYTTLPSALKKHIVSAIAHKFLSHDEQNVLEAFYFDPQLLRTFYKTMQIDNQTDAEEAKLEIQKQFTECKFDQANFPDLYSQVTQAINEMVGMTNEDDEGDELGAWSKWEDQKPQTPGFTEFPGYRVGPPMGMARGGHYYYPPQRRMTTPPTPLREAGLFPAPLTHPPAFPGKTGEKGPTPGFRKSDD